MASQGFYRFDSDFSKRQVFHSSAERVAPCGCVICARPMDLPIGLLAVHLLCSVVGSNTALPFLSRLPSLQPYPLLKLPKCSTPPERCGLVYGVPFCSGVPTTNVSVPLSLSWSASHRYNKTPERNHYTNYSSYCYSQNT